ncbi:MAG: NAD-dependent epimerase/dehydratase family protein [Candidatus Omnitrophica bacterium]|nr:NAD-dependent epimerase/dehydratase family protein [Candidatus Omnitrophota bacterium]
MKVGVVGGTGNISSSFIPLLLEKGHEVVCFNRGKSGNSHPQAKNVIVDRHDRMKFIESVREERLDAGIDMICFNRNDAEASLEAFRDVSHFIHCSTVCTYGIKYRWLPVNEDHPLDPISDYGRNKVAADHVFLEAYHNEGFPVTLIKPSTTYGPIMGIPRQIALEHSFIDRIGKGKPILVCGDGTAIHQFLHVEDAALCFANVLGKRHCIGQTYNLVKPDLTTWADYHRAVMKALGREVEMIGVPLRLLEKWKSPGVEICAEIFAHNSYFASEKLYRDIPEFRPLISLEEGVARVIESLDREGRIPDSDPLTWEDEFIRRMETVIGAPHE